MANAGAPPRVVLVGRPNVGKSTLFNRIAGSRRAIVNPMAGTTRDAITERASWANREFDLSDSGGMFGASEDPLHALVVEHGRVALSAADIIVFLVDGSQGKVPADDQIAEALRPLGVPVVVGVNKADDRRSRDSFSEFHAFGFDPVMPISAEHGTGVADLLDEVIRLLPESGGVGEAIPDEVGIAIVGRPNVGKSSLLNRLLREERVLVSDMPGTTRDAVDATLRWHRRSFRIVDTAGIRRAGRVAASGRIEATSVLMARRAIERADVAVVVIDAKEGATEQDANIAGEVQRAGRGIVVAVNKWDLLESESIRRTLSGRSGGGGTSGVSVRMSGPPEEVAKQFDDLLRRRMKFLEYAPIVHVSALTGEKLERLLRLVDQVAAARQKRVTTAELNRFIARVTAANPPVSPGRRAVKIMYGTQTAVAPPTFVFFTNTATKFHFSYERYLENQLRESFGFLGTPIRIHVRRG